MFQNFDGTGLDVLIGKDGLIIPQDLNKSPLSNPDEDHS
jgi:hypothetical protein